MIVDAPRRHGHQQQRLSRDGGHVRCESQLVIACVGQVDRHQHRPTCQHRLVCDADDVEIYWRHDQDRRRGVLQHRRCRRSENQAGEAGPPPRSHDDQSGILMLGLTVNGLGYMPGAQSDIQLAGIDFVRTVLREIVTDPVVSGRRGV